MRHSTSLAVFVGFALVAAAAPSAAGAAGEPMAAGLPADSAVKDPEAEDREVTDAEADLAQWLAEGGNDQVHAVAELLPDPAAQIGPAAFGGARWAGPGELHLMVVGEKGSLAWNAAAAWGQSLSGTRSAVLADVEVVVSSVERSRAELDAIVAEIRQVIDDLVGPGHMASAAVRSEENAVDVEVTKDVAATVSTALADRYGNAVRVTPVDALGEPADRRDDTNPFYGGVALWLQPVSNPYDVTAYCTAGFTWRLWSNNQLVGSTAGHCTYRGDVWWNATTQVGTVTHRGWGAGHDGEFITPPAGTSWDRRIWVGGPATTASWPVVGAVNEDDTWEGSQIVISGANGGETRGIVTAVDSQICYYGGTVCVTGTTEFRITEGGIHGGDSGAPCFSSAYGQPRTVVARGMITGPRDRGVGQHAHCEPVTDISAALGGSIYTY